MDERRHAEQKFQITFGRRFNERYARFYRRIHRFLYIIQIGGALGAFSAYLKQNPDLTAFAGLVIAIATAIDVTVRPSEKAAIAIAIRKSYLSLSRQLKRLAPDEIDDEIARLQAEAGEADLESLRNVAYNDTLIELGYDKEQIKKHKCRENPFNWFFRLVA